MSIMRIYKVYQQNPKYGVPINWSYHLNIRKALAFFTIVSLMIFFKPV